MRHQRLLRQFLVDRDHRGDEPAVGIFAVSYTHLRAHETVLDLVCRLLLETKTTYRLTRDLSPSWHSPVLHRHRLLRFMT